jgi:hypothetical protein
MKRGDLFVVRQRFSGKNFLRVFHENRGDVPYHLSDCFEVPIGASGIFLETMGVMHLVLFPLYGTGWVYDSWLNREDK